MGNIEQKKVTNRSDPNDNNRKRPSKRFSKKSERNKKVSDFNPLKVISKEEEEKRKKEKEIEMLKNQLEDSKMREDEVKRAVNTVFMTSLPLKANEKDIYNFLKVGLTRNTMWGKLETSSSSEKSKLNGPKESLISNFTTLKA